MFVHTRECPGVLVSGMPCPAGKDDDMGDAQNRRLHSGRTIVSGRDPFEVTFLVAALVCGIALVVSHRRPLAITAAMPVVVQEVWEVGLILVGIVGLLGIAWRGQFATGLGVELCSLVLLGTTTSMYSIALFAVSGTMALAAGSFITAVAVASWWRSAQIMRDLRRLARISENRATTNVKLIVERDPP
jgi:hypothetical protein